MDKEVREVLKQAKKTGLEVLGVENRKSGHKQLTIRNKRGKQMKYFFSVSPSDARAQRKRQRDFRRFSEE